MIAALVVGGGVGRRMGLTMPKQLLKVAGRPLLGHTLAAFDSCPSIDQIALVVPDPIYLGDEALRGAFSRESLEEMVRDLCIRKLGEVTYGGDTRQESVYKGLKALPPGCSYVAIHDAARPMVTTGLVERVIKAAMLYGAAVPAIPLRETVKYVDKKGFVRRTLPRRRLMAVQTPQVFLYEKVLKAHEEALQKGLREAPDDAFLLEAMGEKVYLVEGDPMNMKLTYRSEIPLFEALLAGR